MARSRRNPAWLAPLLAAVVPLVISGIGKVLGYGVSTFNALPREERRAKLRQVLTSKALYVTGGPVAVAAARKVAASPAALDAVLDTLERHGEKAVSASTGAAQALASKRLAGTGTATEVAMKTNGRRRNSSLVGTVNDRLGLTPYLRGDGAHDAVYHYIVSGALPADAAGRARLARVVEQAATSSYADTRHAGRELARVLALPRSNGRRRNHYHVGPAVAMVNRRRNGGPSPWKSDEEYYEWKRRADAEKLASARTSAGKLAVKHGGEPDERGEMSSGWGGTGAAGQRLRFGRAYWRVDTLPSHLQYEAPTYYGMEAIAAYILANRVSPVRSNGRRRNGLLATAATFAAGAVAEKKLGVVDRATGLLKNPANPADPRRDEYLSLVASSARQVVRERRRSAGSSYHGDNERGLETALGMAEGMGYGKEARALARAILRDAPPVNLAPGVAHVRGKARAHRAATGDRNWPARNRGKRKRNPGAPVPAFLHPLQARAANLGLGFHYRKTGGLARLAGKQEGQVAFRTFDGASVVLTRIDRLTEAQWGSVVDIASPLSTGGWTVRS